MKYLIFHLLLVVPPVSYLLIDCFENEKSNNIWAGTGIMTVIAVLYTTPWDAYLIDQGVWFYGTNVVIIDLFGIPLGEYLFFILQTIGVSLFVYYRGFNSEVDGDIFGRVELSAPFLLLSAVGLWMVYFGSNDLFYLGSIMAWAGPVILLQWIYGSEILVKNGKNLIEAVFIPLAYLCAIDFLAIKTGLWTISSETSIGTISGFPIEEAVFFLMTTVMVVQGIILYEWTFSDHSLKNLLRGRIDYIWNLIN